MAQRTMLVLVCAAMLLLTGCANSELNREASQTFPIRQMDSFFGYRAPPAAPPASAYLAPNDQPPAPDSHRPPGYAPAYPPYTPSEDDHL